ncbi:MAG: YbfB/YjiJ family MFS transporter [Pseudonocardia sp.]|uniref:YbfB/YjiJ family MFS transporter n=1 Tax=unclassified Pseudonocardia TaxID=2619320 RepID=UPI00086A13AF|nr:MULTISPECIES: YbfB/YjiJ family MFS transporter [unclassified Pseudonocardia]MBN9113042.1 YbfB/YjiJ family MFS transporter [Pseudonocardia sp.]ODU13291.1 MAG: MFS transporter [Pseudonocardia sp. SCN 72-51]ODV05517.1 MAG: MFS transporter [Pseudonocardia sp. SCN 73-27]
MTTDAPVRAAAPWRTVALGACALATAMGIGRFVYTPILPLMEEQAGLSAPTAAALATANYVGYLVGAIIGTVAPAAMRSRAVYRLSLLLLVASVALMPVSTNVGVWVLLRGIAGVASAVVFVAVFTTIVVRLRGHAAHLVGWTMGGVGVGIALSGLLVALLRTVADWTVAWWASAALAALLTAAAWLVPVGADPAPAPAPAGTARPRTRPWFVALFVSYSLEGVGYIIAGTFLVAAVQQNTSGGVGAWTWIVVGLAALPSCALWTSLIRRWSRPTLLLAALLVQTVGVALPALFGGTGPAVVAAVLFGATFLAVATISLPIGTQLGIGRAVAVLTVGYSVGQILGPVLAAPLLDGGYRPALLLGAIVVAAAAVAAAALRFRFPHHL